MVKINQYISGSLHPSVFFSPLIVTDKGHVGFSAEHAQDWLPVHYSWDAQPQVNIDSPIITDISCKGGMTIKPTQTWRPGLVSMWRHPKIPNECISNIRAADVSSVVIHSEGMAVTRFSWNVKSLRELMCLCPSIKTPKTRVSYFCPCICFGHK